MERQVFVVRLNHTAGNKVRRLVMEGLFKNSQAFLENLVMAGLVDFPDDESDEKVQVTKKVEDFGDAKTILAAARKKAEAGRAGEQNE